MAHCGFDSLLTYLLSHKGSSRPAPPTAAGKNAGKFTDHQDSDSKLGSESETRLAGEGGRDRGRSIVPSFHK